MVTLQSSDWAGPGIRWHQTSHIKLEQGAVVVNCDRLANGEDLKLEVFPHDFFQLFVFHLKLRSVCSWFQEVIHFQLAGPKVEALWQSELFGKNLLVQPNSSELPLHLGFKQHVNSKSLRKCQVPTWKMTEILRKSIILRQDANLDCLKCYSWLYICMYVCTYISAKLIFPIIKMVGSILRGVSELFSPAWNGCLRDHLYPHVFFSIISYISLMYEVFLVHRQIFPWKFHYPPVNSHSYG